LVLKILRPRYPLAITGNLSTGTGGRKRRCARQHWQTNAGGKDEISRPDQSPPREKGDAKVQRLIPGRYLRAGCVGNQLKVEKVSFQGRDKTDRLKQKKYTSGDSRKKN